MPMGATVPQLLLLHTSSPNERSAEPALASFDAPDSHVVVDSWGAVSVVSEPPGACPGRYENKDGKRFDVSRRARLRTWGRSVSYCALEQPELLQLRAVRAWLQAGGSSVAGPETASSGALRPVRVHRSSSCVAGRPLQSVPGGFGGRGAPDACIYRPPQAAGLWRRRFLLQVRKHAGMSRPVFGRSVARRSFVVTRRRLGRLGKRGV